MGQYGWDRGEIREKDDSRGRKTAMGDGGGAPPLVFQRPTPIWIDGLTGTPKFLGIKHASDIVA